MDAALRKFIDKTGTVFKLQIALCNCDLKIARFDGNLPHVKKMLNKQNELAEQFGKWKRDVRKYYSTVDSSQDTIKKLQLKIQHAEKEAERLCDLIEQKEKTLKKKVNVQLSESLIAEKSFTQRSPYAKPERTNDKYPLKQDEYNARMSIPLEEHLKSARSYSRAEITSEIKTDITDRQADEPLFSISWEDFTSYFLVENRKQHEADRLIENTIFRFVDHYWKSIEPFANNGLVVPRDSRSTWSAQKQWVDKRLDELKKIVFKPFPLPKKLEETMRNYLRLINDAVIDVSLQVLRAGFFDAFRTTKISDFCTRPSVELFREVVLDEITKDYGLFNTRQVDATAEYKSHLERLRNEPTPSFNKWMLAKIRLQHEIARQRDDS